MNDTAMLVLAVTLLALNAYFVMAEYALVSARPSRLDAEVRNKVPMAKAVQEAIKQIDRYVALIQICITGLGIAVGAFVEPWITSSLEDALPDQIPTGLIKVFSILIAAYPLVIAGELVPKYLTLQRPEAVARGAIGPLRILEVILRPLTLLFQISGQFVLKILGIKSEEGPTISSEEIHFLLRSGKEEGHLAEAQADVVAKALRLDKLDAEDAMVHRLDVQWLDVSASLDECLESLKEIGHSRIPVCDKDIDEMVGIVYIHDIVRAIGTTDFRLSGIMRPPVFVPENLTLDRLVGVMREEKTQVVIVQDEYGGTSGLVTLEDVVEEIFGDLEDAMETERPPIEWRSSAHLTAKADVRYDELLDFVGLESPSDDALTTQPLAGIILDNLARTPKVGDEIQTWLGSIRVEQLSRRRIIRVGITLSEEARESLSEKATDE